MIHACFHTALDLYCWLADLVPLLLVINGLRIVHLEPLAIEGIDEPVFEF